MATTSRFPNICSLKLTCWRRRTPGHVYQTHIYTLALSPISSLFLTPLKLEKPRHWTLSGLILIRRAFVLNLKKNPHPRHTEPVVPDHPTRIKQVVQIDKNRIHITGIATLSESLPLDYLACASPTVAERSCTTSSHCSTHIYIFRCVCVTTCCVAASQNLLLAGTSNWAA